MNKKNLFLSASLCAGALLGGNINNINASSNEILVANNAKELREFIKGHKNVSEKDVVEKYGKFYIDDTKFLMTLESSDIVDGDGSIVDNGTEGGNDVVDGTGDIVPDKPVTPPEPTPLPEHKPEPTPEPSKPVQPSTPTTPTLSSDNLVNSNNSNAVNNGNNVQMQNPTNIKYNDGNENLNYNPNNSAQVSSVGSDMSSYPDIPNANFVSTGDSTHLLITAGMFIMSGFLYIFCRKKKLAKNY